MPASFVLASASSSTYRKGTPPVLPSAAALLNGHFEPPVSTAENDFQRRSRFENILDVPQGYAYGMFSPVALLDNRFERSWAAMNRTPVLPSAAALLNGHFEPPVSTAENDFQRRSRFENILDVPQGYAYGMFSPVALLEDRFERSRGRTKEASVLPSAAAVATHGSDPRLTKNRSASILDSCSA